MPLDQEVERISAEYLRRSRELPADFYEWSRPANLVFHEQVVRGCIELLHRARLFPLSGQRVLDVGCGSGTWLLEFVQWGAQPEDLCGIDLSPERIGTARVRLPSANLRIGSASDLPWSKESFHLVSQFTVFTSILDAELKRALAKEMWRVLKPGGVVLWFDFRVSNPKNRNVRGIGIAEIRSLFPAEEIEWMPVLLVPPLTRALALHFRWLIEPLSCFPWLLTHCVSLIHKPR
jgi:SAM-dependent methyltransferase